MKKIQDFLDEEIEDCITCAGGASSVVINIDACQECHSLYEKMAADSFQINVEHRKAIREKRARNRKKKPLSEKALAVLAGRNEILKAANDAAAIRTPNDSLTELKRLKEKWKDNFYLHRLAEQRIDWVDKMQPKIRFKPPKKWVDSGRRPDAR